jgi:tripartite-type tricarboxylate transporter receptor subunit TctC
VKGFTMPLWYGMFAPAATPREIVSRLSSEILKALETADLKKSLTGLGVDAWPGTAEQLGKLLREDIERYGAIARSAGLPKQ